MYGSEHFVTLFIDYHHTIFFKSHFSLGFTRQTGMSSGPFLHVTCQTWLNLKEIQVGLGQWRSGEDSSIMSVQPQHYMYLDKSFIFTKEWNAIDKWTKKKVQSSIINLPTQGSFSGQWPLFTFKLNYTLKWTWEHRGWSPLDVQTNWFGHLISEIQFFRVRYG